VQPPQAPTRPATAPAAATPAAATPAVALAVSSLLGTPTLSAAKLRTPLPSHMSLGGSMLAATAGGHGGAAGAHTERRGKYLLR
jgi:hypothetical protein